MLSNTTIELIGSLTTVIAITGVVLNNRKNIACFYLWFFSNALSMLIHLSTTTYSLALRDFIFVLLAIEGVFLWKKKSSKEKEPVRSTLCNCDFCNQLYK